MTTLIFQYDYDMTRSVTIGAHLAINECSRLFRYEKWSCPASAFSEVKQQASSAAAVNKVGRAIGRKRGGNNNSQRDNGIIPIWAPENHNSQNNGKNNDDEINDILNEQISVQYHALVHPSNELLYGLLSTILGHLQH